MGWFVRYTRFGDAHLVFGQEARMSCGIASILMCVFKINKFSIGKDATRKNTEIYDMYSSIVSARTGTSYTYDPNTTGTHPELLAEVLNRLDCGKWVGGRVSATQLSGIIDRNMGKTGGLGPTVNVNPVIAGVGWNPQQGHATVIDTVRKWNGKTYATLCDPWDANVHIVPFDPKAPFTYRPANGGLKVDFWGATQADTRPAHPSTTGTGIAVVYRV